MGVQEYGKEFIKTILEIIEDQPNYSISIRMYVLLIVWHFFQISGYVYVDEVRQLFNEYVLILYKINVNSTLTYLLYFKENSILTLVFFAVVTFISFFYLSYLFFITTMKIKWKNWIINNRQFISSINQLLNTFFIFFQWVFFIPFFEMNIGVIMCGSQGFLVEYREVEICNMPLPIIITGSISTILTFCTSSILIFFYRNYEFNEKHLLKRRFHPILFLQLCCYFLVVVLTYAVKVPMEIKFIFLQIITITLMYDLLANLPFRNPDIIKYYATITVFYEVFCIVYTILLYNPNQSDDEMIFQIAIIGSLITALTLVMWFYKYEHIMKINQKTFPKIFHHLDFYLEEIYRLSSISQSDNFAKYKLLEIVAYHQVNCNFEMCHCKNIDMKNNKNAITHESIIYLIDSIFQWSLKQKILINNKRQLEHISLKYISFVAKYLKNPTHAYLHLKSLASQRKDRSFYFESICNLLSQRIEQMIEERIQRESLNEEQSHVSLRKDFQNVTFQENLQNTIIPTLQQYIKNKMQFWDKIKSAQLNIDEVSQELQKLSCISNQVTAAFSSFFSMDTTKNSFSFMNSFVILKLLSIYKAFVCNQIKQSAQFEQKAVDLIKKDIHANTDLITNFDIVKGNVITIQASLLKSKGKILNTNKDRILKFFGYSQQDQQRVCILSDLMPNYYSKVHNHLMNNIIIKGYSPYFNINQHTYALNKEGFIFPINMKIDFMNTYHDDFVLNGCITKFENLNNYVIIDSKGFIQGITEQIYQSIFNYAKIVDNSPKRKQFTGNDKMNIQSLIDKVNIFYLMPSIFQYIKSKQNTKLRSYQSLKSIEGASKFISNAENLLHNQRAIISLPINLKSIVNYFSTSSKANKLQSLFTKTGNSFQTYDNPNETEEQKLFRRFQLYFDKNKHVWEDQNCLNKLVVQFNLQEKELNFMENDTDQTTKVYYILEITDINQLEIQIPKLEDESTQSNSFANKSNLEEEAEHKKGKNQENFSFPNLHFQNSINEQQSTQLIKLQSQSSQQQLPLFTNFTNQGSTPLLSFQKIPEDLDQSRVQDTIQIEEFDKTQRKFLSRKPLNLNLSEVQMVGNSSNTIFGNLILNKCINESNMVQQIKQNEKKLNKEDQLNEESFEKSYSRKIEVEEENQNQERQQDITNNNQNNQENDETFNNQNILHNQTNDIINNSQYDIQGLVFSSLQSPQGRNERILTLNNLLSPKSPKVDLQPMESLRGNEDDLSKITPPDQEISTARNYRSSLAQLDGYESPIRLTKNQSSFFNMSELNIGEQSSIGKLRKKSNKKSSQITFNMNESTNRLTEVASFWKKASIRKNNSRQATISMSGVHDILPDYISELSKGNQTGTPNKQISDLIGQNTDSLQDHNINNALKNKASKKQSITTLSSNAKGYDNDIIQTIAQKKNPKIINLLNVLLSKLFTKYLIQINFIFNNIVGRFVVVLLLVVVISILSITQIQNLINDLATNDRFKNDYSLYTQELFTGLKLFEMEENTIFTPLIVQKYQSTFEMQLADTGSKFSTISKQNFDLYSLYLINSDRQKIGTVIYSGKTMNYYREIWLLEFVFKTLNSLLALAFSEGHSHSEGLFYLIANCLSQVELFTQLQNQLNENIQDIYATLSNRYIIFGIIVISAIVCLFLFSQFFLFRLARYQEKIILLVTKIDQNDVENEIYKLNSCLTAISKENDSWMLTNFCNIVYYSQRSDQLNISNNNNSINSDKKQTKQLQIKNNKVANKNKTTLQFSSILQGQSISTRKFQFFLLSVLILCTIFFTVVLVLSFLQNKNMNPSLTLQKKTSELVYATNTALIFSELMASQIAVTDPYFPKLQTSQYLLVYQQSINTIKEYVNSFISYIDEIKYSNNGYQEQLNKFYSSDLCSIIADSDYCTNTQNEDYYLRMSIVSAGISGLLTRYTQIFGNIVNILQNQETSQIKSQLINYMNSQENELLIFQGYDFPLLTLRSFQHLIYQDIQQSTESQKNVVLVYFIAFGIILLFLQILIDNNVSQLIKKLINRLNFSLTFIPIAKQQEEITVQMLKQIHHS